MCRDNHGLFVRPSQIEPLGSPATPHSGIPMPKSRNAKSPSTKKSNLSKSKGGTEQEPSKTPPLPKVSPVVKAAEEEEKPLSFAVRQ